MKKFFHKLLGTGFALLLMVGAILAMSLSANAATTSVSIGGVILNSGEYLPTGQTTKTTTKPSGGYAYFNNGVLTLHNYELNTVEKIETVVKGALTLTLSGTSTVTCTGSDSALYVRGNLTVSGNGKLIINATADKYSDGIFCSGDMIFQSGTMEVKANDDAIYAAGLELKSGKITINSERIGVRLQKDSTFSGGKLIVNAKDDGIQNTGNLDICGTDVTITAGGYGIKVDQYINKVTIRGASDVRIDSKHTGILCHDIIVTDLDAKVVISGESKAAVEFFSKQFDSDLAITVSNTADGSEATNYYGTLGGYKYLYLRMPDLYVCGVPMAIGDYYRDSCSAATTYAYSYGYARAQLNGERTELTLYRFAKGGKGNTPAIHSPGSLLLILDGDNYISSEKAPTIKLDNGSMEVLSRSSTDEGRLFITAEGSDGIQLSKGSYYQTSGIINITAQAAGVNVYDKEVSVTGGKLDAVGNARALSCGKITYRNLQIKASQAASGALGNYSGSYMNKYKHIVIADHFCTGVLHPARESSCTTAGKQAYYECSCGRYYEDAACLVEIGTLYLWGVIPETGHTPKDGWAVNEISHYKVCKVCNAQINDTGELHHGGKATCQQKANCTICGTAYDSLGNHSWSKTWDYTDEKGHYHRCTTPGCGELSPVEAHAPGAAATETREQICTVCSYIIAPKLNHQHTVKKYAEVKATCEKNGNAEYYACTGCSKIFKDAGATKEYPDLNSVLILASGHQYTENWNMNETEHWRACTACGAKDGNGAHIPGAEATDTTDQTCTICSYVIKKAVAHTHTFSSYWFNDNSAHWKACTCGEVNEKSDHADADGDHVCDSCRWALEGDTQETTEATELEDVPEPTEGGNEIPEKNDKQGGIPWWLVLLLALLMTGCGVMIAFFVSKKKAEKE